MFAGFFHGNSKYLFGITRSWLPLFYSSIEFLVVLLTNQKDYEHSAHKLTYYVVLCRCGCQQGLDLGLSAVLKFFFRERLMTSFSEAELF